MQSARIRSYRPDDLDAVYRVCLLTGDAGEDWTPLVADPMLPGDLFAAPYAVLQPDLAFVAENADGVGGYIFGTDDTAAFERRLESEWFPELRARHPDGSGDAEVDRQLIATLHHPEHSDPAIVATHPAHLHVNLMARLQGEGLGRALIDRFSDELAGRGVSAVHVGVNATNRRAFEFYQHLGFEMLRATDRSVSLGRVLV